MPVVISPALVLSGASTAADANAPLLAWENIVAVATVSAGSSDADYPVSNLGNPSTHLLWKSGTADFGVLDIIIDRLDPVDYVAVARHNWGSLTASVAVVGYATQADYEASPQVEIDLVDTALADDSPAIFRFEPQSLYAVRVTVDAPTDAGVPSAAVLYCGLLTALPRNLYVGHAPISLAREVEVANGMSETAEFLGRIVLGRSSANGAALKNLPPAWVRTYLKPFLAFAEESPFFFAWRPAGYPAECGFVWLTNKPRPTNQSPNGFMQVDLQFNGIV